MLIGWPSSPFLGARANSRALRPSDEADLGRLHVALIPSMRSYSPGLEFVRPSWGTRFLWRRCSGCSRRLARLSPIITSSYAENDPRGQMLISVADDRLPPTVRSPVANMDVRSVRRWISELMEELGVSTRLQLGAALARSDGLHGDTARAGQALSAPDTAEPRNLKATPAVLRRTAGVAQGEELRAEPRGKVHTGCAG